MTINDYSILLYLGMMIADAHFGLFNLGEHVYTFVYDEELGMYVYDSYTSYAEMMTNPNKKIIINNVIDSRPPLCQYLSHHTKIKIDPVTKVPKITVDYFRLYAVFTSKK